VSSALFELVSMLSMARLGTTGVESCESGWALQLGGGCKYCDSSSMLSVFEEFVLSSYTRDVVDNWDVVLYSGFDGDVKKWNQRLKRP
jgi:hypothetical protein